jgi:hypothetical protein
VILQTLTRHLSFLTPFLCVEIPVLTGSGSTFLWLDMPLSLSLRHGCSRADLVHLGNQAPSLLGVGRLVQFATQEAQFPLAPLSALELSVACSRHVSSPPSIQNIIV